MRNNCSCVILHHICCVISSRYANCSFGQGFLFLYNFLMGSGRHKHTDKTINVKNLFAAIMTRTISLFACFIVVVWAVYT